MSFVQTDRNTLWTFRRGDTGQPACLMIHGAGGMHLDFSPQLRHAAGFHTITPDLAGHGRSAGDGRDSIDACAADMVALLDALDVAQTIVIGHSMGSAIAQTMAHRYSGRVRGLVLVGSGITLPVSDAILQGLRDDSDATVRRMVPWMWRRGVDEATLRVSTDRLLEASAEVMRDDFLACNHYDASDWLSDIGVDTLVMAAEQDRMTPPAWGRELADRLPNATYHLVADAGHMMLLEQPQATSRVVIDWMHALV